MKFYEKLYEVRKKAGMTQNDLADKLNVSRQAVSRWEMGTAMPDVENLVAISDLFGVSLDYLLKDSVSPLQQANERTPQPEKNDSSESAQKGSWLLLLIATPLIGLSLLLNGWLFEKEILINIGLAMIGVSFGLLVVGSIGLMVYLGVKKLKANKK